ncbi:polysaccharide deacetylase family protein [Rhodoplanes sp. Z2-YC6860]|uniref:polysaccharide deacetylase family protein n=1 Tax=Rhodoplanes sp. Z2-YC6860 TaxID=674703 RepID=UPI00082AEF85|nr:polysaccharide deacetylase family protein [Rhodoplanes sp. Z2-YC6860]
MRGAAAFALAMSASLLVLGPASAQNAPPLVPAPTLAPAPSLDPAAAPTLAPAPLAPAPAPLAPAPAPTRAAAPTPSPTTGQSLRPTPAAATAPAIAPQQQQRPAAIAVAQPACTNPNALGVARTVEIDTSGGPGFGFEHFKQHDFLKDKEVVLTFDDGPWVTTPAVLKALADECVRATFFSIGKHATYYPEILRQVVKAGHTVGSHTWSHADLSKLTPEQAKDEIEKSISAVKWALEDAGPEAPFFRFPALRHPPEMVTYLGQRNISMFSTDIDSFDFKIKDHPDKIIASIMSKLAKRGKGIILMHDFQKGTAHAMPKLLADLKAGGYKIVHMRPANPSVTTLPEYDEALSKELAKENQLPTVSQRPTSSVVKTVD